MKMLVFLPNNEIIPHAVQTIRQNPMLPEYRKAAVGDTNIPDPIITLIIILMAAKRPMPRLRPPAAPATFFIALSWIVAIKKKFYNYNLTCEN